MKGDLLQDSEGKYYREGDLPVSELKKMADRARVNCLPAQVEIYYKFTCEKCGARCTFGEPDTIYESGDCWSCGHNTPYVKGGFMLSAKFGEPSS